MCASPFTGTKTLPFPFLPFLLSSHSRFVGCRTLLISFSFLILLVLERLLFSILLSASSRPCTLDTARDINPLLYIPRTYSRFSYCDRRAFPRSRSIPRLSSSTVLLPSALAYSNVSAARFFSALSSALIPTWRAPPKTSLDLFPLKSMPLFVRRRSSFRSSPVFRPNLSFDFAFRHTSTPGYVPDLRYYCRLPFACASMRRTCVHLRINQSRAFFPRYLTPFVIPLAPSQSPV